MSAGRIRTWTFVHKWTSLVCTAFLLILCITGLPLIFHEEIDELTRSYEVPALPAGTAHRSMDAIVDAARARHPELVVQFVFVDPDEQDLISVSLGKTPTAQDGNILLVVDARSAQVLGAPETDSGFLHFMLTLHTDMFAGLPGKLFLGLMGLVFIAAVVSGVVVYGPFTRKLDFAAIRVRNRRLRWLDLHNLLGVVTVTWVMVVGFTGVLNTWADLALKLWQFDQLAAMTAPYRGTPPLTVRQQGSVQRAIDGAKKVMPDMKFSFVAYPGTAFSSPHHYAVFMRGTTPFTSRLLRPALMDAQSGNFTDSRDLPWYITGILVSQPLHFGDYGGMPLKIIWAMLDLLAIVVLGSGLYLWFVKRRVELAEPNAAAMAGAKL